jgi:tetratricopeptide (TPR) repeat protein
MRARQALKHHQLAVAEELMPTALDDVGPHAIEARETLVNLFKIEGRFDEARRLVRERWDRYPDRVGALQELARLESDNPVAIEVVRPVLTRAYAAAPDDDRIWLGWASLAMRTGRFDEAREWLDASLRRRPDDPAIWRMRLDWARAAEDEAEVRRALAHLTADRVSPAEVLGLRAWFSRRAGDPERERHALEELLARDPGALRAMERLAELLLRAGQPERAEQIRARKGTLGRTLQWYVVQITRGGQLDHAAELARAADALNWRFEARRWWELAAGRPDQAAEARAELARFDRIAAEAGPSPSHPTPADLLAELESTPSPRAAPALAVRPGGVMPHFVDDAQTAGLRFSYDNGLSPLRQMPETMGGGIGLLDYDGDGWLDVYVVQGGRFPLPADATASCDGGGDRLFRNRGDGTFEDATARSGISALRRGYGHGVAVGDVDNDGHPDLFLTRWRSYALYRNRGDGTFEDITESWGLGGDRDWPTSAAFADLDGDGDLDLYVCHYLEWDSEHPSICRDEERQANIFCNPRDFKARPDHLFRNDGGRFVDVTKEAGIVDEDGRGLGVVACDFDADGHPDLFVANDLSAKLLFRNRGGLRFEEVGHLSGVASNAGGLYQASMGVACGDLDGDGRPDLAVTNFYNEYTALYLNLGGGVFSDQTASLGLALPSRYRLGFGVAFLDANNDGRLDLATANGHVDESRSGGPWRMCAQLFLGAEQGLRLVDVTERAGTPWQVPLLGRGLAVGDLDNDGCLDLLILPQNQPLAYFRNRTEGGRSLTLKLEGGPSNRDAIGARVVVDAGGRRRFAWRLGGGSYQSSSDPRLHFGLGTSDRVQSVEVLWPSGRIDRYTGLEPGGGYRLREGEPLPRPLPGFGSQSMRPMRGNPKDPEIVGPPG